MTYDDRPYPTEKPDEVRRRWDRCPPAGLERARPPDWNLQRWKVTRDLIVGWYGDDRPDSEAVPDLVEAQAGWLDPVQRHVVEQLFAGWRAMFPKDPRTVVDLEPGSVSVYDHDRRVELKVASTFAITRPDGTTERIRLKTGRSPTGPDDAAVLHTGSDPGVDHLDALVALGVAEEIPSPEDPERRLEEVLELAIRDRRRVAVRPGLWCFGCDSAARCVQYPVLDEGRVFWDTRAVTVSKTALGWVDVCHRRVAWDRVHQVPGDERDEIEPRHGLSTGLRFHDVAASAILSDDPEAVVESAMREAEPSEASELRRLWDNHLTLWRADGGLQARTVEYPAGLTLLVPGVHLDSRGRRSTRPVAVTLIGVLDVTGREPDGTPMVVEHRTGSAGDHGHLEAELYAVSAAAAVRRATGEWPERVSVHLHHLRPERPTCERRLFDRPAVDDALRLLRETASQVAAWDPDDALHPDHQVGPWCGGCRHRRTCENFR